MNELRSPSKITAGTLTHRCMEDASNGHMYGLRCLVSFFKARIVANFERASAVACVPAHGSCTECACGPPTLCIAPAAESDASFLFSPRPAHPSCLVAFAFLSRFAFAFLP
eukprot:366263-Chlamydomonas_euryale.AAC.5